MPDSLSRYRAFARHRRWEVPASHESLISRVFLRHRHFTENDFEILAREAGVSPRTVRLVIDRLLEAGMIRRVEIAPHRVEYEHTFGHAHHDHIICTVCGRVEEIQDAGLTARVEALCRERDYTRLSHQLRIQGVCAQCRSRRRLPGEALPVRERTATAGETRSLAEIPNGHTAKVLEIAGGLQVQRKLRDLGIHPGVTVEVSANRFAGPFLLRLGSARIGLGHRLTHKVLVEDLGPRSGLREEP